MKKPIFLFALAGTISACSTVTPKGPKLYDNVTLVVTSENALLMPSNIDKDYIRIVRQRLEEFTAEELSEQGDLQLTRACAPRTMQVIQEITSLSMGDVAEVSAGMNPFRPSASTKKSNEIRLNVKLTVNDCDTGKKLYSYAYPHSGEDPIEILKSFASWNAGYAYTYQHEKPANR